MSGQLKRSGFLEFSYISICLHLLSLVSPDFYPVEFLEPSGVLVTTDLPCNNSALFPLAKYTPILKDTYWEESI